MARDSRYDVVKGIAIVLMVVGHVWSTGSLHDFIYLFHIPAFFILAGWFYHTPDNRGEMLRFVWKRLCRLWWPFVFWAAVGIVLHDVFVHWEIYAVGHFEDTVFARQGLLRLWGVRETLSRLSLVPFFLGGATGMGAPYWFLQTLFYSLVFYMLADVLLARWFPKPALVLSVLALLAVGLGRYADFKLLNFFTERFGGRQMLTGFFLVHLGRSLRLLDLRTDRLSRGSSWTVAVGSAFLLLALRPFGSVELVDNRFPSLVFLTLTSVAGWFLLCVVAEIPGRWSDAVAFVGRKTLPILLLHLYAFKLVSFVGIRLRGDPTYLLGRPVTTYDGLAWGCAYVAAGVLLPLLVDGIWYSIRKRIKL